MGTRTLLLACAASLAACTGASESGAPQFPAPTGTPNATAVDANAPRDPAFAARALELAGEYTAWGRVDDELRWAPFLCRIPMPGTARVSESTHTGTHGQKLYSVFAKHRDQYPAASEAGQVIVKESYLPEVVKGEVMLDWTSFSQEIEDDHFHPYAKRDGVTYRAGDPAGLYLMFKLDPRALNTDEGWVYATITPAGEVTAAGRIASCMTCHENAPHHRLFGVGEPGYYTNGP